MLSSEERSGLRWIAGGGAALLIVLLIALGFFRDTRHEEAAASTATPTPKRSAAGKLGGAHGRVIDRRTGFGVAARTVELHDLDGIADPWLAPADELRPGEFELHGVPATPPCAVTIAADGYQPVRRKLAIAPGESHDFGDVALTPLVTLVGRVVDSAAIGVAGAEVAFRTGGGVSASTTADPQGNFRFERLAPSAGELLATTSAGDATLAALPIDGSEGGEIRGVELDVVPTFPLRALLRRPIGAPPLLSVSCGAERTPFPANGRIEFAHLHAGPATLLAWLDGRRAIPLRVDLPIDPAGGRELTLELDPAQAIDATTLSSSALDAAADCCAAIGTSAARATLAIRVVDDHGEPLSGARLDLWPAGATVPLRRYASRDGRCVTCDLTAGTCEIAAFHGTRRGATQVELTADATGELVVVLRDAANGDR